MVDFTPAEEVESVLVVPREKAEKAVRDFFREESVVKPGLDVFSEDLVVVAEVVVVLIISEAVDVAEGTLVEAAEMTSVTPVEEGVGLTIMGRIKKVTVVTTQLAMVMSPLHF